MAFTYIYIYIYIYIYTHTHAFGCSEDGIFMFTENLKVTDGMIRINVP
jgi:hypothetical protein